MSLTQKERCQIIEAYDINLTPMRVLANQFNVTERTIHRTLNKAGVDTSKRKLPVSCTTCGKMLMRTKGRIRKQKNHYCGYKCWQAHLQNGVGTPYVRSPYGSRIARSIVSKYFKLENGYVVHHENRDCLDNRVKNLKVFRYQGDHVRYHRDKNCDVEPAWDGSTVLEV